MRVYVCVCMRVYVCCVCVCLCVRVCVCFNMHELNVCMCAAFLPSILGSCFAVHIVDKLLQTVKGRMLLDLAYVSWTIIPAGLRISWW